MALRQGSMALALCNVNINVLAPEMLWNAVWAAAGRPQGKDDPGMVCDVPYR